MARSVASGTSDAPIVFTSYRDDSVGGDSNNDARNSLPSEGDWEAIYLNAGSDASILDHVEIRYAGNYYEPRNGFGYLPALTLRNTNAKVQHAQILFSDNRGIEIDGGAPTLDDVRVAGACDYAFHARLNANPITTNLAADHNRFDAYLLHNGDTSVDIRLTNTSVPYTFFNDIAVALGTTLTLDKGTVFKMGNGHSLVVKGTLDVNGTPQQPVQFTTRSDDSVLGDSFHDNQFIPLPGSWEFVELAPNSTSTLDYLTLQYGGNYYHPGNGFGFEPMMLVGEDTTATGLVVRGAERGGVVVRNGATLTASGGRLEDNINFALSIENGTANLTGMAITSTTSGISVAAGSNLSITGSAIADVTTAITNANTNFASANAQGNWWGHANGPHDPSAGDGRVNNNLPGPLVSDWVDYSGFLTSAPTVVAGPYVTAIDYRKSARIWHAEGTANETQVIQNGSLQNGVSFAPGKIGQAFQFDGIDDFVQLPNNLFPFPTESVATTPFSFEAWFQTTKPGVILGQQATSPFPPIHPRMFRRICG